MYKKEEAMKDYTIGTKCVQAGYTPGNGEPRQIPIVQSTTFYTYIYQKNTIILIVSLSKIYVKNPLKHDNSR